MNKLWIDNFSDRNPQLFREIKGRFNLRNVAIAAGISIFGQLILLMSFLQQLPTKSTPYKTHYCLKSSEYDCFKTVSDNFQINWQLWSMDIFLWLSFIGVFALLIMGSYMLISDLAGEERRGTLNFIRVSPRSTQTILTGKLLGVPILLYLAAILVVPLHLWVGLSAQIQFGHILMLYAVVIAGCIFFYSGAILFGLASAGLGGFQPWLGSGLVFMFLAFTALRLERHSHPMTSNSTDWINLFNPAVAIPYLAFPSSLEAVKNYFPYSSLHSSEWFYFPVNSTLVGIASLMVLNFALWTYWMWQGLNRRFPNPSATIFSKRQSYALTACFQVSILGFALQGRSDFSSFDGFLDSFFENLCWILGLNFLMFLGSIALLSPHRQALQDWARYQNVRSQKKSTTQALWQDLIWGEQSPAVAAIALNLLFTGILLGAWILLWPTGTHKIEAVGSLILFSTVILFCAIVAQLMLLMKTPKRGLWAAGTVAATIILPPIILALLSVEDNPAAWPWLFTSASWIAVKVSATKTSVFVALLGQWLVLAILSLQLTRQLRRAGESASKALLKRG